MSNFDVSAQKTHKLFDNLLSRVFIYGLPFTYALTINLKFPFKISELALLILLFFLTLSPKIPVKFLKDRVNFTFFIFLIVTFFSTLINLFWSYPYHLSEYESRFGYSFDSILKFIYLILAFFTLFISSNLFLTNRKRYIRIFLSGGILASIYGWYLLLTGLVGLPQFMLPGIEEPQYIALSFGTFIRSGTFKEGNFMGLFLIFCMILSFYTNKKLLAYYFAASLIPTFSSIGLICATLFLIWYWFKKNFTKKRLLNLVIIFSLISLIFISLLPREDFRFLILSKLSFGKSTITNNADISRTDRLNSLLTAIKIGLHNPFIGVGISNFARHSNQYSEIPFKPNFKGIANNIYAEIFAEVGVVGLIIFLYLLFLLYRKAQRDNSGIMKWGLLVTYIYFFAFPTFTILFVWVFFGLANTFDQHTS